MKKYLGLLGLLACGPEPQVGCQTDYDCREGRVCDYNECVEIEKDFSEDFSDDVPDHLEDVCVPSLDVCDGQDNDCNNLVDEFGCGTIFNFGDGISKIDLSTLVLEVVSDLQTGFGFNMSPDGTRILTREMSNLYATNVYTGQSNLILSSPNVIGSNWKNDHEIIYGLCFPDGGRLYSINVNGSDNRELVATEGKPYQISLGEKVFFAGYFADTHPALYVVDYDGGNLHQLVEPTRALYIYGSIGDRVYFSCDGDTCSIKDDGTDRRLDLEGRQVLGFNPDKSKAILNSRGIWDVDSGNIYRLRGDFGEERFTPFAWR